MLKVDWGPRKLQRCGDPVIHLHPNITSKSTQNHNSDDHLGPVHTWSTKPTTNHTSQSKLRFLTATLIPPYVYHDNLIRIHSLNMKAAEYVHIHWRLFALYGELTAHKKELLINSLCYLRYLVYLCWWKLKDFNINSIPVYFLLLVRF